MPHLQCKNRSLSIQFSSNLKISQIIRDFIVVIQDPSLMFPQSTSQMSTMERTTQTEPPRAKKLRQIWLCFLGDDKFRRQRQREATEKCRFSHTKGQCICSLILLCRMCLQVYPIILNFCFFGFCFWTFSTGGANKRYVNSVSLIDRTARIGFPLSFGTLILLYWLVYVTYQDDFPWVAEQDFNPK